MKLIIVESPTKAKTLSRFLGKDFDVLPTMGHIKDLPKSKLSVDIDNNFAPDYQDVPKRAKVVSAIKKAFKKAETTLVATDPDREGEAIAAHVYELLTEKRKNEKTKKSLSSSVFPSLSIRRIVFHEITKEAVEEAIKKPRDVDRNLINAQIARRVLDRLVGYKLSPLLWKKVRRGLSAGRVQSVAVRLIVERENQIKSFKSEEYWDIWCDVSKEKTKFRIDLVKNGGKKVPIRSKEEADRVTEDLSHSTYTVLAMSQREVKKNPYPPFTTSTMSQAAANLFSWSAKRTMSVAQKLYEEGLITYHRTDSTNIAASAMAMVRSFIKNEYGQSYLPENPRFYKVKAKVAQEAHEAIRPTSVNHQPSAINHRAAASSAYQPDAKRLYELIWKRFVASQMESANYKETKIDVLARRLDAKPLGRQVEYLLRASGQVMKFDGWRKVLPTASTVNEQVLPDVEKGDRLNLYKVHKEQKFTQPPARYNEASLIKELERLGIGRPSTYAPIITTIQIRQYVEKIESRFFPTPVGTAVNDFLTKNFSDVFEYSFTAGMEADLDHVAEGKRDWTKMMKDFWNPFEKKLTSVEKKSERVKIETEKLGKPCPECLKRASGPEGSGPVGELVIRIGRFGKFISCSRFPDCKYTEKFVEKIDMKCPKCGKGEVVIKKTKRGRKFFGCSLYPKCDYASWKKPDIK